MMQDTGPFIPIPDSNLPSPFSWIPTEFILSCILLSYSESDLSSSGFGVPSNQEPIKNKLIQIRSKIKQSIPLIPSPNIHTSIQTFWSSSGWRSLVQCFAD